MDIGEGANIASIKEEKPKEEVKEDKKHIKIRCCVFFDGTLNNVDNINQRLICTPIDKLEEDEKKIAEDLKNKASENEKKLAKKLYKKYGAKGPDEENSYEGGYTNIVKMKNKIKDYEDFDFTVKLYIEGAGSLNLKKDQMLGYAFAICKSGVYKKVKKGINKLVDKIIKSVKSDVVIDDITVDVFGFSRGAAEARNFIYEILIGDKRKPVAEQLEQKGYEISNVNVNFVGLYDTVSTYGLLVAFGAADNVKELHLDSVRMAKKVVQLASADEHREYFSLTNINSASTGTEIFLPGVHSDIGGGYLDNKDENIEINWVFDEYYANEDCKKLIEEGWYTKNQFTYDYETSVDGDEVEEVRVFAKREKLRNAYSLIPLNIMAGHAKENGVMLKSQFEIDDKVPSSLHAVKAEIDKYIAKVGRKSSKFDDWSLSSNNWNNVKHWVKDLRREYCHFSAKIKIGHTPRTSFWSGERYRKIYSG